MNLKAIWNLLKDTFTDWNKDQAPRLAAALAYYAIFSIAPLLIIVIAIVGLWFGRQAAQGQILTQIQGLVGQQGAQAIQGILQNASQPRAGLIATIIGIITVLLGASGFFGELQNDLNAVWEVEPKQGGGILDIVKDRFLSFTMVLGIGFLLLVSLVISGAISAVGQYLSGNMPALGPLLQVVNLVLSFAVITLLFGLIYKILPDAEIHWGDVWIGAAVTSLLFTIGKFAIGFYLGHSSVGSAYGAAGSLIVTLVWVYYSAQILLFGAEFTQVYANRYGSQLQPERGAAFRPGSQPGNVAPRDEDRRTGRGQGAPERTAEPRRKGAAAPATASVQARTESGLEQPQQKPEHGRSPLQSPVVTVLGAVGFIAGAFVGMTYGARRTHKTPQQKKENRSTMFKEMLPELGKLRKSKL